MFKNSSYIRKTAVLSAAFCLILSMAAYAAQGKINFSDPTASAGDEVNVTMKVSADDGTSLKDANIVLTYPTDKLEFVSGTDSDGGAGAIRVHGSSNGSGTALLEYNLKFKALSAGTAEIKVDTSEIYDSADQPIELTHTGSSAVTIGGGSEASENCLLSSLEVYPGELDPAFSAETDTYSVTIGSSVDKLSINAIPADSGASVEIQNNADLPMGESQVTVVLKASDGTSTKTYTINVTKEEGGPENVIAETDAEETVPEVEGVQLSSKGKTITIMNPDPSVAVPEGFRQGTIKIDDQKVQGWVWGADENPEYCVVYGMNDKGEVNFYRYDMQEKTIQRYFEDPLAADSVSNKDYQDLMAEKEAAVNSNNFRFIIICGLAALAFILLLVVIILAAKVNSLNRNAKSAMRASEARTRRRRADAESEDNKHTEAPAEEDNQNLLKHNFEGEDPEESKEPADETQVIKRTERKRRAKRVVVAEPQEENDDDVKEYHSKKNSSDTLNDLDI